MQTNVSSTILGYNIKLNIKCRNTDNIMSGQMNYTGLQVDHRFWQLTQVPQGHQKRSTGWRGGEGTDSATI